MDIDKLTLPQLEELEKEVEIALQDGTRAVCEVEVSLNRIAKAMTRLELRKKDLRDGLVMGRRNIVLSKSQLRMIKSQIYRKLRGE